MIERMLDPSRFGKVCPKVRRPSSVAVGRTLSLAAGLAAVGVFVVLPVSAQYTSSGTISRARQVDIPSRESLEKSLEEARWNLGPLRVQPWIGLRNAAYVDSQSQGGLPGEVRPEENDFTVTAGAGIRAYLRTGSKVTWAAQALPEYTWWQDTEEKRGLNGRYGLGVFGHFNRVTLELSHRLEERQDFFSSEVQELTTLERQTSRLQAEVEIRDGFFAYGKGEQTTLRGDGDDRELFTQLDRDTDTYAAGLRFEAARGWSVSLGFEETETEFEVDARSLSNEGSAIVGEIFFDGPRLDALVEVAQRDLEAVEGSTFGDFDDTTGRLDVVWDSGRRTALLGFARRELGYSVQPGFAYFLRGRQGIGVRFGRAGGSSLLLTAATGEDDFEGVIGDQQIRTDDVEELTASLGLELRQLLQLSVNLIYTEYDSNFDAFDRDVTSVGLSVQLGEVANRLRLGQSDSIW
ncbi:MAG: hypothetical protein AAGN66_18940 [Acidobacteriota bacterium]